MTRFIVDASVLIAALKRDGKVRGLLMGAPPHVSFYAPEFILLEIDDNLDELARDVGVPRLAVEAVLRALKTRLTILPPAATEHVIDHARRLAERADAEDDEEYVALALAMDAPLWSFDKDFDRIPGIRRVDSRAVEAAFE